MKFFLIGDKETVLGFSLAGIEGAIAESESEILAVLREAKKNTDIGIFLITERLGAKIRPVLDALLLKKGGPLVLEIPDCQGLLAGKRSVEDIVLSALGIKV